MESKLNNDLIIISQTGAQDQARDLLNIEKLLENSESSKDTLMSPHDYTLMNSLNSKN